MAARPRDRSGDHITLPFLSAAIPPNYNLSDGDSQVESESHYERSQTWWSASPDSVLDQILVPGSVDLYLSRSVFGDSPSSNFATQDNMIPRIPALMQAPRQTIASSAILPQTPSSCPSHHILPTTLSLLRHHRCGTLLVSFLDVRRKDT
jgi:hypothetical protein